MTDKLLLSSILYNLAFFTSISSSWSQKILSIITSLISQNQNPRHIYILKI